MPVIQSYFLAFNKSIIQDDKFFKYWQDNIDEHTHCLEDVYAQFETGLFYYLTQLEKRDIPFMCQRTIAIFTQVLVFQ